MNPEDPNIEIKAVEEETVLETPSPFSASAGGSASVNLRLLTQEEFDRHNREREAKEKGE